MKTFKAIVFDIDGTLTNDASSWTSLTEKLGASKKRHNEIHEDFVNGKITHLVGKKELVNMWHATGNANREFILNLFNTWELKEGVVELVEKLQNQGYTIALISGSMDLFVSLVAHRLNIDNYYANAQLIWDKNETIINFLYEGDQGNKKKEQLLEFCKKYKIEPSECVVIGDSENDIELFKLTDNGIAILPAHKKLKDVAWKEVSDLKQLESYL